ncbi:vesicle coat component [Sporothrix bragantina]|uniref:Protein transport protein sec16 n=1 Tax=Sporothrix bragantina TaxID=671064 RepID=A0ABP0BAJ7_9PEZI
MSSGEPNAAWHPAFMPHQAQAQPSTQHTAAEPNAAWHPAFMPHTVAEKAAPAAAPPAASESASNDPVPVAKEPESAPALSLDLSHDAHDAHDDTGVDAWFPEYDAGSPWTEQASATDSLSIVAAPEPATAIESEPEPVPEAAPEPASEPARAATPDMAPEILPESTPEPAERSSASTPVASPPVDETASKHFSTISFTRTVANDVNWDAEEDEPEWNISRTDTDPFRFMPASERSNSFPVVPPQEDAEQLQAPYEQQPLASTQAMNIIQEVDNEVSAEAKEEAASSDAQAAPEQSVQHTDEGLDAWGLSSENGEDPEGDSFFAGGGAEQQTHEPETAAWEEPETPDARFEEGVPLIPHETPIEATTEEPAAPVEETQPTQEAAPPDAADPFAETADDDDDFFNNAGASAESEPQPEIQTATSPVPPVFERKSTMQVLQAMNVDNVEEEEDSFFASKIDDGPITEEPEPVEESTEAADNPNGNAPDLADQWAALLDDEDELLLDDSPEAETETKELDPAAFFGDDDEGFLDDDTVEPTGEPVVPQQQQQQQPAPTANRYLPQASLAQAQQPQRQANPYLPSASFPAAVQTPVVPSPYNAPGPAPSQFPLAYGYGTCAAQQTPPAQQEDPPALHKAQSFADKSKGGYSSPYDLPMDIVKQPRKRQSMQQMHQPPGAQSAPPQGPPPRSSSMQAYSPAKDASSVPPPPANHAMAPPPVPVQTSAPPAASKPPQPVRSDSFFEDLPVLPKVRPASRHSLPSPSQTSPYAAPPPQTPNMPFQAQGQAPPPRNASPYTPAPAPPQTPSVPPPNGHYAPPVAMTPTSAPPTQPQPAETPSSSLGGLVAPPRANPYASLQSAPPALGAPVTSPPAAGSTRYSPSPNQLPPPTTGALPNRYSPAPPPRVPSAGYAPSPTPPILAHQPRTSSPLAHFEMSYEKPRASSIGHNVTTHADNQPITAERRSSSSIFESRLNRVPSLPPTREEEEEPSMPQQRPVSSGTGAQQQQQQQYPPAPTSQSSQTSQYSPLKPRQTPPPQQTNAYSQATLSPPKRILNYAPQNEVQQSPPRRSQTQSPGALYGGNRPVARTVDPIPRPSSVQEAAPAPARPRAASQNLNLVPPTDGSETDPLQRWKGAPIFAWGVGGTFVSSFPQDVPRYGMNQALPMIHRAAGEVQVKNIKEIQTLDERQAKFPGPLKGKSKKKEVLTWLAAGIESLERSLPTSAYAMQVSLEDKRLEERVLLWKILHLFIEHDGVLEGNPAVEKAVRAILSPDASNATDATSLADAGTGYPGFRGASSQHTQADAVDSTVIEQIRKNLLLGNKEKAVWDAVDKRLWGHAFLIAGAASRELFKKVAQEFVRKEVNTPGLHNESLAALYEVLSGNHEECVDELVPVHARAGLHLMATTQAANASQAKDDELAGLDKWRETLSLILSNRSTDDVQAINSLGDLLSGYGRAEAAHVCFLFSRSVTVFGGLDDPAANVVLLGADHKRQADSFAKETDAVLLSEVYEYGLSLAGGSNLSAANSPHLAAYKLQHAMVLAEYGLRDKALQYCEAIVSAMSAQTRRSPYYHPLLESAVEDLMKRLKQAPKEESNSWIPKPSMNKVSDSVWNRFNKFVAGDENEGNGAGADGEAGGEIGPFSKIAGGTPTISRPPSAGGGIGATGMEMFGGQNLMMSPSYGNLNGGINSTLGLSGGLNGGLNGSASMSNLPTMAPTRAASRYAPGAAVSQPIPIPSAPAAGGLASPPVIHNSFDAHNMHSGYTPLGVSPAAVLPSSAPSFSPYEPTSNASSAYAASPARRVSSDQSVSGDALQPHAQPQQTLRRQASELSLGYSPYTPAPNAGARPSLSRKSSYAPLSQAEPTPPVPPTESATPYNPYAPSDSGVNGSASASPYAPVAAAEPTAEPTPQLAVPKEEEEQETAQTEPEPEAAPSYGYQAPSYGYEPPSMNTSFEPVSDEPANKTEDGAEDSADLNGKVNGYSGGGGYEPPSFQPYSYEPPSYEPDADAEGGDAGENGDAPAPPKPKVKSFMDDDEDDGVAPAAASKPAGKSREEKDRENAELVRKIAEDEAKRAAAEKEAKAKKGWGISSWWGKKDTGLGGAGAGGGGSGSSSGGHGEPPKAVRANLGEKSSFYFDPELKRWINKNASPEDQAAKSTPPPPPPRSNPHSASSTPAPPPTGMGAPPPPPSMGGAAAAMTPPVPSGSAPPMMPPSMARTASAASAGSGPPSRPATSMGEATSIDDLLGSVPGPRKAGAKKGRKSGRYVDVMAK